MAPLCGRLRRLVLAALAALASACINGSPTTPVPAHVPPAPTLSSLAVTGGGSGNPGETTQLAATATYSDGSSQVVTALATWTSANAAVATVSAGGLVTFVAVGEADIQAVFQGLSAATRVNVVPAPIPRRTLTGTVIDGGRRVGLDGARVEVTDGANAGRAATTAADGTFSIPDLLEGTFTIRISHPNFDPVVQPVTLTATTRVEVTLRPLLDLSALYGTYGISLRVTHQNCSTPITPGANGTLALAGDRDGSNFSATVTERGVSREYRGRMNTDGSFTATGSGFIPGLTINTHDFSGSIQGRVTGASVSGAEAMTYGAPCPGGVLEIAFSGGR